MEAIFCTCEVDYEGRASSHLAKGERVLLIKGDTITVHKTDEGVNPINYMKDARISKDGDNIIAQRENPNERLEIKVSDTYETITYGSESTEELILTGTEKEFQEYLARHPDVIDTRYEHHQREYETGAGPVDLIGEINGVTTLVEVKKTADVSSVGQLSRYSHAIDENNVRGILAYNHNISKKAKKLIKEYEKLTCSKVNY